MKIFKFVTPTILFIALNFFLKAQVNEADISKLTTVIKNVNNYYVDNINGNEVVNKAIVNILEELDPHSVYYSKSEVEDLNRDMAGKFTGIGISYAIIRDTVRILSLIENGPSQKAGILPGDRIVGIEDINIAGKGIKDTDLSKLLLGEKGSKVKIIVKRLGCEKNIPIAVERDIIYINSVDAAYIVNEKTGYIKLDRFSENSFHDFEKAANELFNSGAENLIIDLQGNGGGYLNAAVDICDLFFSDNELLLFTQGQNSPKVRYFATEKNKPKFNKIVVIIDETTASAGEIIAGALQDWDRAVIVGRRSFGKGLVQRPFYLPDGSMMRLTVARYYTPTGRCIQRPYTKGKTEYYNELNQRIKNGEMTNPETIHFNDSLKYKTLKYNRTIYAGGGIMPDIFVPLDTAIFPKYYNEILINGKMQIFIHDFVDKKRNFFNTVFFSFDKFEKEYKVDEKLLHKLIERTWPENSEKLNKELVLNNFVSDSELKTHVKALIARDLWSDNEFYKIYNKSSTDFLQAVNIISDDKIYYDILKK